MIACPSCGEQNPDRFRLCGMCGAPLAATDQPARRERRVVSVLFCDLVGFTGRAEQQDVEDVEAFLSRYHRLLRHALEQHGGTVEKFIGDAVMALFGAPIAHEDDAERAVRAALAIQDAVADLRADGGDVHVRVGVTTGEALVALGADPARGEGMASGDVVNTAARLQSAAPVDGVLVDEGTYRATDRSIRFQPADPVAAKGKSGSVPVWRALATRSTLPEQARVDDLPLVGRTAETGLLTSALERARSEPSTQLVTLIGAPGIGKTRLVQELGRHVDELPALIRWRRGRSLSYGAGVALWALGEMVKAEAGILESDSAEAAGRKLDEAVAAVILEERDRDWAARHLRPLVGLDGDAQSGADNGRVEAFAAWRRFFEALAEAGPTVLVFEDMHWADDTLLDFIDVLAERAGGVPLLVVCTARPELLERRPGWSGGRPNSQIVLLPPLSSEDTARLIGELLDQALLPADTQRTLLERAEGNPLYALEYVRMLRDQQLLVSDGAGWRLVGEPAGLPESVQAIIAARLDTLGDDERSFVQDAAVVGRTAWTGAVAALADRPGRQADDLLHGLERKQLVRRARRPSVTGETEFSFTHALTQEVAYGQIRRAERASKHERAADWIEGVSGGREDKSELLAHHLTAAYDLRCQAGEPVDDLTERLRAARAEAGRQAMAVNAHAEAVAHLAGALELTPADAPGRRRLLLDWATAASNAGAVGTHVARFRAALDAQLAASDMQGAAEASRLLATVLLAAGQSAEAEQVLTSGLEYAFAAGYAPVASRLAATWAYRLLVSGRAHEVVGFTDGVLRQAAEAGDAVGSARVMQWHGNARVVAGDLDGIQEMRQSAAVLGEHTDPLAASAHLNLAEALIGLGDFEAAEEARRDGLRWAERFSASYHLGYAQAAIADSAYHAGDWSRAIDLTAPLRGYSDRQVATYAGWTAGRIALARGDPAGAAELIAEMLDYATESSDDEGLLYALGLSALSDGPDGQAGRRLLDRWQEVALPSLIHTVAELAHVRSLQSQMGRAVTLLPGGSRWRLVLAAVAEGRYADAAHLYREMGSLPLEATAHLLAAEYGDAPDRAAHAQAAVAFYGSVGATAYAERAARLGRATA